MDQQPSKKYTAVRYWRYVFTPLFLAVALFGIFIVFTASPTQLMNSATLGKQVAALSSVPAAPSAPLNIGRMLSTGLAQVFGPASPSG